jgi:hypothetical protein
MKLRSIPLVIAANLLFATFLQAQNQHVNHNSNRATKGAGRGEINSQS